MNDRSLHLFAGPSLGRLTAAELSAANIVLHPPVSRGDIDALASSNPGATIAIADGLFHQQPAVGHVEIRDAIRGGARVWGLCSMGAIRAAELSHLGMHGFGEVFEAYRNDPGLRDDEVALLHLPDKPYVAITEPLIHWRRYFRVLEASGELSIESRERIESDLSDRWYGERTIEYGATLLASIGGIHNTPAALDCALEPCRVKHQDLRQFVRTRPWDVATPNPSALVPAGIHQTLDLEIFGGLPFVDQRFDPVCLLSAVAGTRSSLLGSAPTDCHGYAALLDPAAIVHALTSRLATPDFVPPHKDLTACERRWVDLALGRVKASARTLAPLFELPIQLLRWNSPKVSMTNPLIPQTIFLGDGALHSSFGMMEEVLVHEYAHVWLGMICELSDLQVRDASHNYTLPSGTGPKDARGVLLAAHFAAAVLAYLFDSVSQAPLIGRRAERSRYLQWYLRHALCLPIEFDLTPTGQSVLERLRRRANFLYEATDANFNAIGPQVFPS